MTLAVILYTSGPSPPTLMQQLVPGSEGHSRDSANINIQLKQFGKTHWGGFRGPLRYTSFMNLKQKFLEFKYKTKKKSSRTNVYDFPKLYMTIFW